MSTIQQVVGSLHTTEGTVNYVEWVIPNFKNSPFNDSPAFQMKGGFWKLSSYYRTRGISSELRVSIKKHIHEFPPRNHMITVSIGIKDIKSTHTVELGEQSFVANTEIVGYIANPERVTSYLSDGNLTIVCTFYEKLENTNSEELVPMKKNVNKLEGTDILVTHMKNLFFSRENCDFTIKVQNKEFEVHKAILSARSPVLSAMLQHDMLEKKSNATDIVDCEPEVFEQFLLYVYTGQVEELSWKNATALYTLGDKYDLEHLRKECVEFMKCNICVDSFCDVLALAVKHNISELINCAEKYFFNNAEDILLTSKWQLLMKEKPVICNEIFIKYVKNYKM